MKKCHINLRELGIALLAPICITFVQGLIPSSLVSCVIIIILCGCIHHVYSWVFTTGDNRNNKNRTGTRSLSFLFCFCIFILIVITGLSLQFFSTGILNAIELHRPELLGSYRDMVRSSFSLNNGIFRVTTVMLLAPVCEELVFRGISLSSSRRTFRCHRHPAVSAAVRPLSRQFSPVLLRPSHGNPSRAARHMDIFPAAIDPSSHNDQRIFLFHRDAAICTVTYRLYTCNWYHVSRRLHRPISVAAPKWQITQSILTCDTHTLFHRDHLRILTA